ncbi:PREDICTED: protein DBF4 homolog A-like [Priapulus caudatus]|uniref:Protein DBF4 homolog A-like n=1 Tax=Priapulus caudatus TaxID=37621 RepID=A0ABM1DXM5_PRICU|nr:PREDICTED: protein DBF4 homolog A-like [Priapulus caudatus]XP_014664696.1 PREDICTED: protein DBF4 homolog A-like [Priapulus caudatus]XP_014664697.1 PREDICTED: protein DBF4 homolog A-like [Priapulus caudatus]
MRETGIMTRQAIVRSSRDVERVKRRLFYVNNGMFTETSFYLDVRSSREAALLERGIRQLGGRVERFLCKQVGYVITDKPIANDYDDARDGSHDNRASRGGQSGQLKAKSATRSSSRQHRLASRGQALLERSQVSENKHGNCDVIAKARALGIKITSVEDVKKLLRENLDDARRQADVTGHAEVDGRREQTNRMDERKSQCVDANPLTGEFVKCEDAAGTWRPFYREFPNKWPSLAPKRRFNMATAKNSGVRDTAERRGSQVSVIPIDKRKQSQSGYCECCDSNYSNLALHLRGTKHRNFAQVESNYACVDNVIHKVQSFGSFLEGLREKNGYSSFSDAAIEDGNSLGKSSVVAAKSVSEGNEAGGAPGQELARSRPMELKDGGVPASVTNATDKRGGCYRKIQWTDGKLQTNDNDNNVTRPQAKHPIEDGQNIFSKAIDAAPSDKMAVNCVSDDQLTRDDQQTGRGRSNVGRATCVADRTTDDFRRANDHVIRATDDAIRSADGIGCGADDVARDSSMFVVKPSRRWPTRASSARARPELRRYTANYDLRRPSNQEISVFDVDESSHATRDSNYDESDDVFGGASNDVRCDVSETDDSEERGRISLNRRRTFNANTSTLRRRFRDASAASEPASELASDPYVTDDGNDSTSPWEVTIAAPEVLRFSRLSRFGHQGKSAVGSIKTTSKRTSRKWHSRCVGECKILLTLCHKKSKLHSPSEIFN